jgi:hypothetical protein
MTFGELIDGLGKNLGIELTDEGGATAVLVDGNPIILQAAGDDLVLVYADLGEIAPDCRDRVLVAAMEANFLYQGTGGATLAVDSRNGHLHLQKYNWLDRLDAEKAVTDLTRFADIVKTWKGLVAEVATGMRSAGSDSPAPMRTLGGFMQV